MKYQNKLKSILSVAVLVLFSASCKKGLDYENTGAINPKNVWTDSVLIKVSVTLVRMILAV
jgi:hypothetical protein